MFVKVKGYVSLEAIILTNTLGLSTAKKIGLFDIRVIAGLCEMQGIRFAARRCGSVKEPCYTISELSRLMGCSNESLIRRSLSRLQRVGILLEFSKTAITFNVTSLNAALPTLEAANRTRTGKHRNPFRKIPVLRKFLLFIAKCTKKASVSALLAYVLQCFSFGQRGSIKTAGSVKSSRIAEIAGIGLSSAKRVRAWLIDIEWLKPDTGSTRRKQNSTGAYCCFDPEKIISGSELSHPSAKTGSELSHPYKNHKLPTVVKNKKGSRVSRETVSIRNVVEKDLHNLERLETLFVQASEKGLVGTNPQAKLDFVAAAIRAVQVAKAQKGNAVRLFMGIVRKQLYRFISNAQEKQARAWILSERETIDKFASQSRTNTSRRAIPRVSALSVDLTPQKRSTVKILTHAEIEAWQEKQRREQNRPPSGLFAALIAEQQNRMNRGICTVEQRENFRTRRWDT